VCEDINGKEVACPNTAPDVKQDKPQPLKQDYLTFGGMSWDGQFTNPEPGTYQIKVSPGWMCKYLYDSGDGFLGLICTKQPSSPDQGGAK
jgi:hypothetical protein